MITKLLITIFSFKGADNHCIIFGIINCLDTKIPASTNIIVYSGDGEPSAIYINTGWLYLDNYLIGGIGSKSQIRIIYKQIVN